MKISDDERHEIVKRLRYVAEHGAPEWATSAECIAVCLKEQDYPLWDGTEKLFSLLADLIDPPTCKNLATHLVDELVCSACGERVDIAYLDSEDDYRIRYCPRCGAKVVEK